MKNFFVDFLESISKHKITLLKDLNHRIEIDARGKFKYFYIPCFDFKGICNFIENLDNEFYTLIPILSMDGKDDDPQIILSKQILVSSYSNPKIVDDFLNKQLDIAINDFEISSLNKI